MKITYDYSFGEYRAIERARRRRRKFAAVRNAFLWLLIAANFGIGFYALYLKFTRQLPFELWQIGNLTIGILILLFLFVLYPWWLRWYFRQHGLEGMRIEMEIGETAIETRTEKADSTIKWSGIIRADEEPDHFLLWISKVQAYSIPKHAFKMPGDMEKFRQLVADNVTDQELAR